MGNRLMALVLDGPKGRLYVIPTKEQADRALAAHPAWLPELKLPQNPRDFKTPNYGIDTYAGLFLNRQAVHLNTLSSLVIEAMNRCRTATNLQPKEQSSSNEVAPDSGAMEYADAVALYLSVAVGKVADYGSANTSWSVSRGQARNTFVRQAIPMMWGTAEINPFAGAAGDWAVSLEAVNAFTS